MTQQESPRNSGARTSDWIGQVKNRILYAYDVGSLDSTGTTGPVFTKEDFEQALTAKNPAHS